MQNQQITKKSLNDNLPAGAKAFQAAIDGVLTEDIWKEIITAQIKKAQDGDRGAAKFLIEYAGGVSSFRGATFVQENHTHQHFHESEMPKLTDSKTKGGGMSIDEWERKREERARQVANGVSQKVG